MAFTKIKDEELEKVGVTTLEDTPALEPDEMKAKFEETAKELLAPKFNKLVEELQDAKGAKSLGANAPEGFTGGTVQDVMESIGGAEKKHEEKRDNPHSVTAQQVGAYTKKEADEAIRNAVDGAIVDVGAGDMARAIYDPNRYRSDVFASGAHLYRATLRKDGWSGEGLYTQTALLTSLTGGPPVNATSILMTAAMCEQTEDEETNESLQEVLSILNMGYTVLGTNSVKVCVFERPTIELDVFWQIKQRLIPGI